MLTVHEWAWHTCHFQVECLFLDGKILDSSEIHLSKTNLPPSRLSSLPLSLVRIILLLLLVWTKCQVSEDTWGRGGKERTLWCPSFSQHWHQILDRNNLAEPWIWLQASECSAHHGGTGKCGGSLDTHEQVINWRSKAMCHPTCPWRYSLSWPRAELRVVGCYYSLLAWWKGRHIGEKLKLWRKQGCSDYSHSTENGGLGRYMNRWRSGPGRDSTACAKGSAPMFRAYVEIPRGLWKGPTCGFVQKEHALCISLSGMKLCLHQTTQSPEIILRWCSAHHTIRSISDGVSQHCLLRIWLDTLLVRASPLLFA